MDALSEKRAIELRWNDVCDIVTAEIEEILGTRVQCKINVIETSFWDVTFVGYRLPLPKLCQLLQATQATPEDWEDALPDEGGVDVAGIGIALAEKLVGRHLHLNWKQHLIAVDSLWLVDVAEDCSC